MQKHAPKRALISVSDKTGLIDVAKGLQGLGWEIISTGGTAKTLADAGIPVTSIDAVTEFPECFGGRLKTLHPKIFGGILYRRGNADDEAQAEKFGIIPIDLVVVNLYPFAETIKRPNVTREEAIEQIDIGGPSLLRAAAKNQEYVTVVCDPNDYERVLNALKSKSDTGIELRKEFAAKVFLHTATYDALVTEYLSDGANTGVMLTHGEKLRYGENPHQWGTYYSRFSILNSQFQRGWGNKIQGKEMSYLNILDADAAWVTVQEFSDPTAVFVKHANPSGIASNHTIDDAFQRAYDADRLSAFGVIIALNRECSKEIAKRIIDQKIFVEVIVAPRYTKGAVELLKQKPNLRVIEQNSQFSTLNSQFRSVTGGMLVQNPDVKVVTESDLKVVTRKNPTKEQLRDLLFAWKCVKYAKSNAIVFAKDSVTVGIGAGQTSRVDSTWIAAKRAGEKAKGAVMASDAFFPFPDSVEEAVKNGISAVIQPGGSVRDTEVFAKADELGISMITTGVRAFRH